MKRLLLAALVLSSRPARAGDCDADNAKFLVERMEALGKQGKDDAGDYQPDDLCLPVVAADAKLKPRMLAACGKVLARLPRNLSCAAWGAELGAKELGGRDLFAILTAVKIDPIVDSVLLGHVSELDDPRGAAFAVDVWKRQVTDKRSSRKSYKHELDMSRGTLLNMLRRRAARRSARSSRPSWRR
jgi:hypothetical protein